VLDVAEGVRAEGFERGCGGLAHGRVELLDGREGFAKTGSHGGGDGADDVFLVRGLGLHAGYVVAGVRVLCCDADHVVIAELCDVSGQVGFDSFALRDLADNGGGEGLG
jgi:hypothetical protein